ncbi:MAG TPA: group 1 truncated hemoglobin [Solirubrobacteraceae bacterium]|jgi:hemoglobin|nr:group 1 truncated hemoglobin [Solirubrobacteraceae bacterium]
MQMTETMYEAIGGDAGLTVAVDDFYRRLWADDELKGYFEGIDRDALKYHQRMFLTMALGGGDGTYAGQSLPQAHTGLSITDDAFDKVAEHLRRTLVDLKVDKSLLQIIIGYVEGKRNQVVMQLGL